MNQPFNHCPSFSRCSASLCPLDPEIRQRNRLTGEEKCRAKKSTRRKIGEKYSNLLKYKGLTIKEYMGYELARQYGYSLEGSYLHDIREKSQNPSKTGIVESL